MSCDEIRPLLSDYLVGVLAEDQQVPVEEHLTVCAECATALADLVTLEDDLRALSDATPAVAPRRSAGRWSGLAVAASLLLGLGLGVGGASLGSGPTDPARALESSPSLLHGALASAGAGEALPLGRALTATGESVIDLTGGSLIEAEAGARLALLSTREVRQLAGSARYRVAPGESPFDVHMPHGRVRALGTIFRIEVQEAPMQTSAKAAAGVAVVIGVVSGVVLVTSDDASQPEVRLEAGQRAVATAGSISLETGGIAPVGTVSPVVALRAQVAQQRARIATLEAEKAALTKRLAQPQDDAPLTKPGLRKAGNAPVAFGRWGEVDELKDVDWKAKGAAARKLRGLLGKLLAALDAGDRPSPELGIAIAKSNQVLAQLALAINGKLPTHATGNGEFTHPYVLGNLMAEHLAGSGAPLTQRQIARLQQLGERFDTSWEVQQRTYGEETFKVQKIVDEVLLKQKMMARFRADLDPTQREALVDPELTDLTQLDIFSPSQLLNGVARPLGLENAADLPERLRKVAARELGVEPSELEPFAGVFTTWSRSLTLTPVPRSRSKFVPIADVARAGKAQVQALQELALRINASDETKARLRDGARIYVPRLLKPKQK